MKLNIVIFASLATIIVLLLMYINFLQNEVDSWQLQYEDLCFQQTKYMDDIVRLSEYIKNLQEKLGQQKK